jgi:filamentous hemagglutinin family protein
LGTAVDAPGCTATCNITGGAIRNTNLFQSFQEFSIPAGGTATLLHDPIISNIFMRVTGGAPSNLYGTLQTDTGAGAGNAAVFLLNPAGILFGPNATLNIGGSFIGSTADSIRFADGTEFRVADTQPLLSISTPIGLQFGNSAGSIRVGEAGNPAPGNGLFLNPDFSISRDARPAGLTVPEGQTLALVGNGITLTGGNLTAPAGSIALGSVTGGLVTLAAPDDNNPGWRFDYDAATGFGDITLTNAASVDASGDSGGRIQVQGQTVTLTDGSAMLSETLGAGTGGLLTVTADTITLSGESAADLPVPSPPFSPMPSGLFVDVGSAASGAGGDLAINTRNLQVEGGAQVSVSTFGSGDAGNLTVTAEQIDLVGGSATGPSALYSAVGFSPPSPAFFPITGNAGAVNITTERLSLRDGAQILAITNDFGDAGTMTINASDIELIGGNEFGPSALLAPSAYPWSGDGGNLTVNTDRLLITGGAQIATSTASPNPAGNITINATDSVNVLGTSENGRSGIFSTALFANGSGGNVTVTTGELAVRDGATLSVSNFRSMPELPGPPPGRGPAGEMNLTARTIILDNGASLSADTVSGDRANINLQADGVVLRRGSSISTDATGTATGGNIYINAGVLTAIEASTISANAVANFGGRVVVDADSIILSEDSAITATSALGPEFSGTVELNAPIVDPNLGVAVLSEEVASDQGVVAACEQAGNTFVATGRGGLPEDASQQLRGRTLWQDLRLAEIASQSVEQAAAPAAEPVAQAPIVEAQGVMIDEQGEVHLFAQSAGSVSLDGANRCLGGQS